MMMMTIMVVGSALVKVQSQVYSFCLVQTGRHGFEMVFLNLRVISRRFLAFQPQGSRPFVKRFRCRCGGASRRKC